MAKALSPEDIEAICERLKAKDIRYASELDARQDEFLKKKPRIKNWQEFRLVEDIKRVMVGLHTDKVEHSGKVEINVVSYKDAE